MRITILWHVLEFYAAGCALMAETVQRLASGQSVQSKQQPAGGNYYSFPDQTEPDAFVRAGWRLIDSAEIEGIAKRFMGLDKPGTNHSR